MADFLQRLLTETWPARMAKSAFHALMLPGDVYQGNVSMQGEDGRTNPEVIGRSTDLAGLLMGGSYAAPAMKDATGMGIRAYHGSPHDFDKFDLKKIGTGEGAQAYGHGLYFAENEGVARGYRDTLAGDYFATPKGRLFDPQQELEHLNVRSRAHSNGSNLDATIELAQRMAASDAPSAAMAQRDLAKLQALKDEGGIKRHNGKMYEVNINADPAHFLDWDKPLSQQGPQVQQAFGKIVDRNIAEEPGWSKLTGQEALKAAAERAGSRGAGEASLREAGIPGIKYLDRGSRGAGQGSSNYVVFNDSIIDILRKYGLAPPAAAGAATYAMGGQGDGT